METGPVRLVGTVGQAETFGAKRHRCCQAAVVGGRVVCMCDLERHDTCNWGADPHTQGTCGCVGNLDKNVQRGKYNKNLVEPSGWD